MRRRERSAGVVLFRKPRDSEPSEQYLLLDYGKHWDFPKGHVELGEDDLAAALRELKEETGIATASIVPGFAREIRYFFRNRRKELIDKAVVFFLAHDDGDGEPVLSSEHVGSEFLSFPDAVRRLTYPTARQVLREADDFLKRG
jgi:8-oxo-dGTP pyrophosphatase MutT (NUDIX family)